MTRPDTPLPWLNYLGSDDYFGLVTNTAGGYSFYRDPRLRRLTRYRYNNVPADTGGRYLYVRDEESGDFWSPSWQPTRRDLDGYRCRHGLGYTTIEASRGGIDVETTYLVPQGETLELWLATVTNRRAAPARISLFSAVEFCLWDAWDDATNFQRNLSVGEVEVEDGVIYHVSEYRERRNHFAYFACSEPARGIRHRPRRVPRPPPRLGPAARGRGGPVGRLDRPRLGALRVAPRPARARARRDARDRVRPRVCGERADGEVRPARDASRRQAAGARDARAPRRPRRRPERAREPPRALGRAARAPARDDRRRARGPDGERLEPVPVRRHAQPRALRLPLRVRHRARDRVPRLEPGRPGLRAPRPGARARDGSSTSRRRSSPRAARTTSTSRSRSAGTAPSDRTSTTTRCGSSSRRPRT